MASVRLLTGYFDDVDSYAIQDYQAVPIGTIDESLMGLGVTVNGATTWGDCHFDDQ